MEDITEWEQTIGMLVSDQNSYCLTITLNKQKKLISISFLAFPLAVKNNSLYKNRLQISQIY